MALAVRVSEVQAQEHDEVQQVVRVVAQVVQQGGHPLRWPVVVLLV